MLRFAMLCYAMLCYAMLCYAMLYYAMLCYAMLCYAMLCYAMLCYAMLCYAMLCYAMLRYAMLGYAMLFMFRLYSPDFCAAESSYVPYKGQIDWPVTRVNSSVTVMCPHNIKGESSNTTRSCNMVTNYMKNKTEAEWGPIIADSCPFSVFSRELLQVSKRVVCRLFLYRLQ